MPSISTIHTDFDFSFQRFAGSFTSEAVLRGRLQTLFSKMPNITGVTLTHGPLERGKDIVFSSTLGTDDTLLVACVVKNSKITGAVDSSSGAQTVFLQAQQALDHPVINSEGEPEFVNRVYIISPFECSQSALESIKGRLEKRSGQVRFICGPDLLMLFKKHWPDYLVFESGLLVEYLTSLNVLDNNSAFLNFAFRHGVVASAVHSIRESYVYPTFEQHLNTYDLTLALPSPSFLDIRYHESSALRLANEISLFAEFLKNGELWMPRSL